VLLHLARKAFYPAKVPFPLLHIDTGHNFPETIRYRDEVCETLGLQLILGSVQDVIDAGRAVDEEGPRRSRNRLQTVALREAFQTYKFDAAFGGARRDEERSRAKERIYSHRDRFSQWDPKNQRPELWTLFNSRISPGEHFRVFPLSNWTELDVWLYIEAESIPLPSLYFAAEREVFARDGMLYCPAPFIDLLPGEALSRETVRFRTIGDMTCTGAVRSTATTIPEIISEILLSGITERGATRADDQASAYSMEDRKREGYF
jgi:sulfate adenylyltransferase subunit 2